MAKGDTDAHTEDEPRHDGEAHEETVQLIVNVLPTGTGAPAKAGTCAPRYLPAMQPPTAVPGNGPLSMTAEETEPFGAKVIFT